MLLEFGAKNFHSFDEGFEASFRLNKNCPEEVSHGLPAATVMCVKGANASGKTNVLRALNFLWVFCCNSFAIKPDGKIGVMQHFYKNDPSEFYVVFAVGKKEYLYELTVSPDRVDEEILYANDKPIVIRKGNEFESLKKPLASLKAIKLRSKASFISTANQYELTAINEVYNFFNCMVCNIEDVGRSPIIGSHFVSKMYGTNKNGLGFAVDLIKKFDLGIQDIGITEIENEDGHLSHEPCFLHQTARGTEKLDYYFQSSGTKALYDVLYLYFWVLESGGVLVLDEFDINLHPHILPKLVDLFDDPETNPNNAQLIFTTHNTATMDQLGKYRTLMVEKENNASFVYRLDEIPGDGLRNDRKLSPLYHAGKLGGVPKIS